MVPRVVGPFLPPVVHPVAPAVVRAVAPAVVPAVVRAVVPVVVRAVVPAVGVPPGAVDGAVADAKSFNPWTCRPTRPRTPQSLRARS